MERLQEVAARRDRYRVEDLSVNSAAATSTWDPRLKAMYVEVTRLVGIQKPSNDLIAKLQLSTCYERKIVSIFGPGGLGKTTLAKSVYDKLKTNFECRAFVPVGRNPNLSKLLMDILYELDKCSDIHSKNRDERQLIDSLREFLMHKRYFIVIDDIWETTSWEEAIRLALLENNCGSRIIITTRNSQVAKQIGDDVYKMQPLSDENSRKLFYTRIFGAQEKWPHNDLDEIPNKILRKCNGLPLAIITMASFLAGKPRERWSDIFTSFSYGHMDDKQADNTRKILSFSYYDMPANLRTCLLYLSLFPEDYTIDKDTLIWMWIAEGFIQRKQGMQLFEVGELYFNDLVNRSMVQAVVSTANGMVQGCRVHDIVLDFICSISSKENFVTVLDKFDKETVSLQPRIVRRLAVHNNSTMDSNAYANTLDIRQVRLLLFTTCNFGNWIPVSSCKLLRVLDMEACRKPRCSDIVHLGNLLHLRYLSLRNCRWIDDLPDDIAALKHLKILNLEGTGIVRLPASMSQLTELLCLLGGAFLQGPKWIGKLTSLEELGVGINCTDEVRGFLKELGNVRKLRVFKASVFQMDENMQRDFALSLRNLHKLQKLELVPQSWDMCAATFWQEEDFVLLPHFRVLYIDFQFSCLPSCIGIAYLPNLTHLTVNLEHMDQKDLQFLGMLPDLYYLELGTRATTTVTNITVNNCFFRKLRFCIMTLSMIQIQCNEGVSSISFHIWNGAGVMPFGSSKINCSLTPYATMPNLEVLECAVFVGGLKDCNGDYCNVFGLDYLPSLKRVRFCINCKDASAVEVAVVEGALRKATKVHANRPQLGIERFFEDKMISAVQDQKPEDDVDISGRTGSEAAADGR